MGSAYWLWSAGKVQLRSFRSAADLDDPAQRQERADSGTSADILKRALRLLSDELRTTSAKIVNIIHDEIVVEVDEGEAEAVAQTFERAMSRPAKNI
jgi:class 3 adenylate cyclase